MFRTHQRSHGEINRSQRGPQHEQLVVDVASGGGVWRPPHGIHVQRHYRDGFDYACEISKRRRRW